MIMFSNETLSLIRYCLSKGEVPIITDWDTVIKECKENAIIPLLSSCRNNMDIPERYVGEIKTITYQNAYHMIKIGREQQSITDTLSKHSINPIILKGFSLAQYYDVPQFRTYGDVDLLLYKEDEFNLAICELINLKYYPMKEYKDLSYRGSMSCYSRHFEFKKNCIEVELHSRYVGKYNEFDDYLKRINPISRQVGGFNFVCFPDLANGLILLEHLKFHLDYDGVGLRMLIDWYYYAKKVLTDTFWTDCFEQASSKYGLQKLAICMTQICQLYFGLENRSFANEFDEKICANFMNIVSLSGNFGGTGTRLSRKVNSISCRENLFCVLQRKGRDNYSIFSRNKVLYPFSWINGIIISVREILQNQNWISEILSGRTKSRLNKKIKEALDLQ